MASKYEMSLNAHELLILLHGKNPPPGHRSLTASLGWANPTYVTAKNELVDLGLAVVGHGGSLKKVENPNGQAFAGGSSKNILPWEFIPAETIEANLYEPFVKILAANWTTGHNPNLPMSAQITANSGSKRTGGKWSRPDAVAVWVRRFDYIPGDFLEVSTFEIKPFNNIDVSAVFEAVGHRRAATHAYVAIHVPSHIAKGLAERIEAVRSVAATHGVGLIKFDEVDNFETWKVLEEAERFEPNPEKMNKLIDQQLGSVTKSQILKRLGRES